MMDLTFSNIDNQIVKQALIGKAVNINRLSFQQEPSFVGAYFGSLNGVCIRLKDSDLNISFNATIVNDRGPNSAESKIGADFAITYSDGTITKSVIFQAKNKQIDSLNNSEKEKLEKQCQLMNRFTSNWGVFECPTVNGASPTVLIPQPNGGNLRMLFEEYIADYFVACTLGDQRQEFVEAVQRSDLKGLVIERRFF